MCVSCESHVNQPKDEKHEAKLKAGADASNLWHRRPVYGGLSTICHVFNASKSKVGQTTICLPCLPLREHRKHERGNFVTCFQERLSGPGE